jgi:hypothetical protein
MEQQELIERIKKLPPDRMDEIAEFIRSLEGREPNRNRMNLHKALSDYAVEHAGTVADLDSTLERAATEQLSSQELK